MDYPMAILSCRSERYDYNLQTSRVFYPNNDFNRFGNYLHVSEPLKLAQKTSFYIEISKKIEIVDIGN